MHGMILDSPRAGGQGFPFANSVLDKAFYARSVSSANAIASDASSSSSDNDVDLLDQDEQDDDIMTTPQARKLANNNALTPFGGPRGVSATSFASTRNGRIGRNAARHGLPGRYARSAPHREPSDSIYFAGDVDMLNADLRRDSISQSTSVLQISSSNESGDEGSFTLGTLGVVKRPVVRRSNLLVSRI